MDYSPNWPLARHASDSGPIWWSGTHPVLGQVSTHAAIWCPKYWGGSSSALENGGSRQPGGSAASAFRTLCTLGLRRSASEAGTGAATAAAGAVSMRGTMQYALSVESTPWRQLGPVVVLAFASPSKQMTWRSATRLNRTDNGADTLITLVQGLEKARSRSQSSRHSSYHSRQR